LAEYIGVFGTPHNQGNTSIAMTAPVAMKSSQVVKIEMTAPVSMNTENHFMRFFLPEHYYIHPQEIPTPTDPRVRIVEIPSAVGAVHRYSGSMDPQTAQTQALTLGRQLQSHYFANNTTTTTMQPLTDDMILQQYEFWGYNPPFTIPFLRRNEVWIPLTEEQAQVILQTSANPKTTTETSSSTATQ
jgi:hypothetical protein